MGKNKQNLILPPELPPEALEEDIEVSDEALQFINENMDYAGFVSNLDALTLIQPPSKAFLMDWEFTATNQSMNFLHAFLYFFLPIMQSKQEQITG